MRQYVISRPSLSPLASWRQVIFSASQARAALIYVSLVVRDASEAYREFQRCRARLADCLSASESTRLAAQRDSALRQLNAAADDCNAVGADLLDLASGLVRFPAQLHGRPVSLLWRLGHPIETAWQDIE